MRYGPFRNRIFATPHRKYGQTHLEGFFLNYSLQNTDLTFMKKVFGQKELTFFPRNHFFVDKIL